ncbi:MAG: histidine kinase [Coriobacteriaceae bacterium]|nr:histidine kinase [Coriobacteriaceae bacterium]
MSEDIKFPPEEGPGVEPPHRLSSVNFSGALKLVFAIAVLAFLCLFGYAIFIGVEAVTTLAAMILLAIVLIAFLYAVTNPDTLRSQYTEQTLAVASSMLESIACGLTPESAEEICRRLLPETRATTIAVTDRDSVLACVGALADDFPSGSAIHTPTTRYVIEHGIAQSFTSVIDVRGEQGDRRHIPAGIITPLKVRGRAVGTLKFYYSSPRHVNRTQYALASGFAELLSTQLTVHELERQAELTARAEVRALQAQINPHFLFNTLNTIAAFTRIEPLRARELLREFSQFYRATLENSGQLIPVKRELEQTLRYLKFEKARFGEDRIVVSVDVDIDAEEVLVPAFVIQPLVENAVRHAMPDEGALNIRIEVGRSDEDAVDILVADDGVGMDKQTAMRLFDRSITPPDPNAPQGGGAGVAMHNISERIKRFYGPKSRTSVESAPGRGTSISLHLDLEGSMYDKE